MSYSDYYPFHMQMPDRFGGTYRYLGANGQESQTEITGNNSHSTAEYWMYDNRLGRRWNLDPVVKENLSGYSTYACNPIFHIDPNGADTINVTSKSMDANGNKYDLSFGRTNPKADKNNPLILFTVYTEDDYKGNMTTSDFFDKYQTLGKNISVSEDGKVKSKPYAKFISANTSSKYFSKTINSTTANELQSFTNDAISAVGQVLTNVDKWQLFGHRKAYDYKSSADGANGMLLTYIEGVGVYLSDHVGNFIYGAVISQYGAGRVVDATYDGDYLQKVWNHSKYYDDVYDSYALALGVISDANIKRNSFSSISSFHKKVELSLYKLDNISYSIKYKEGKSKWNYKGSYSFFENAGEIKR